MNLFRLNDNPGALTQRLQINSVIRNAFGRQRIQSESVLLERLSQFPICRNKREGKKLLDFGVQQRLLIPVSKNRRRFFASNARNGFY
jgi:hypothetical protein